MGPKEVLGPEVNSSKLEYYLDANIPNIFLHVHKDDVLISTLVEPVQSPLFRWSERTRFTLGHGSSSEHCKMYGLILPSRSFEIDHCRLEKRNERIYQPFNSIIH